MTTIALQHKLKSITLPVINWKALYLFGIPMLFLILVFYVYSINKLIGGSYAIKDYHKEISRLQVENNTLEANAALAGFMGTVQQKARQMGFEKTDRVKYIEVAGTSLAKAQ